MKNILTALAFLALPHAAGAQTVINMPRETVHVENITYVKFTQLELDHGHWYGDVYTANEDDYGILICQDNHFKAHLEIDGEEKAGYFEFDSAAKCDEIGAALADKPNRRVRFTFATDPAKHNAVPGYEGGKVTQIEWLEDK